MEQEITSFLAYMCEERQASKNTLDGYSRDLHKLYEYMKKNGKTDAKEIIPTNLTSYVLYLERAGLSAATISRTIAAIHAFFLFLLRRGVITSDPSERLRPPKIEKRPVISISEQELECLLKAPDITNKKGIRDQALLYLLAATGIRISELIELKIQDVNLDLAYVYCHFEGRKQAFSFDRTTQEALQYYIRNVRSTFMATDDLLFTNIRGRRLSRQGVWKMIRQYGRKAGIDHEITPQMIRNLSKR